MRLLVDVGVGKAVENWLASQGLDMLAVRDVNPRMTDAAILALAVREQRLVITMDKDFGEMVFHSRRSHAGVLLLRLAGATSEGKALIVQQIFTRYADALPGNFCVYQKGRLRIRHGATGKAGTPDSGACTAGRD